MGVGGIAAAIGAAAAVASVAYNMSQGAPNLNTTNAQAAGVQAQAEMLPYQRLYQAAAETGGQVVRYGFKQTTMGDQQRAAFQSQIDKLNAQIKGLQSGPQYTRGQSDLGVQMWTKQRDALVAQMNAIPKGGGTVYTDNAGNVVPKDQAVVDFAGLGQGEVQGRVAKEMAQVQLGLQQKYGVKFAQEAKDQLALSDPEGTAARSKLYDLIEQQNNAPFDQPIADLIDKQVGEQLSSGSKLDPTMRSVLDSAVAEAQAARGQNATGDTQEFATPIETGFEGQQRKLAAEQKATGWEASGSTPEDVQYRHEQQDLANLGAFVEGQTPEAQFGNLSSKGAQQGTTPFNPGQALPQAGNGADTAAAGYTTAGYLQNLKYQQSQANPWMAGLSSLLTAGSAVGNMGVKPLGGG